jgi:hypothetical protein
MGMTFKTVRVRGTATYQVEYDEEYSVPASLSDQDAIRFVQGRMVGDGCEVIAGAFRPTILECEDDEVAIQVEDDQEEQD